MELDEEYESLPVTCSPMTHMCAGAFAGILEHTVMYPIDCVKTRLQSLVPVKEAHYRGLTDGLRRIVRHEGMARTVRGIGVVVGGAGPAHALYFATYERMKVESIPHLVSPHLSYVFAGVCATVVHDLIMTPTDAIKQRIQMFNSPYPNSFNCIRSIARNEGISVLYRAYFTQLLMNIPHQCVHFQVYEAFQKLLNPDHTYRPVTHLVSGGLAGAAAAAITTPLDVCKTLLNTQESFAIKALTNHENQVRGLLDASFTVYKLNGLPGFFKGMTARIIFQMPGTAISWSVYELFKFVLSDNPDVPSQDLRPKT